MKKLYAVVTKDKNYSSKYPTATHLICTSRKNAQDFVDSLNSNPATNSKWEVQVWQELWSGQFVPLQD